jgi:hypothetical protein
VLRRLQDLGQALALGIDLLRERRQYLGILNRVGCSLYVVGADSLDNLVVAAVVGFLGSASSAKKAVRGPLELGVVAACRADDSGAVVFEAIPARC